MQTTEWGPPLWDSLHTITFNAPVSIPRTAKGSYIKYFKSLGEMLPCKYCRQSYAVITHFIPLQMFCNSRNELAYWLYTVHNIVNTKLDKPELESFSKVCCFYEKRRVACKREKNNSDRAIIENAMSVERSLSYCMQILVDRLNTALSNHNFNYEELYEKMKGQFN